MRWVLLALCPLAAGCAELVFGCRIQAGEGIDAIELDFYQLTSFGYEPETDDPEPIGNNSYACDEASPLVTPGNEPLVVYDPTKAHARLRDGVLEMGGQEGRVDVLGFSPDVSATWEHISTLYTGEITVGSYPSHGASVSWSASGPGSAYTDGGNIVLSPYERPWDIETNKAPGDEDCLDVQSLCPQIWLSYDQNAIAYYPVTVATDTQPVVVNVYNPDGFEVDITTTTGGVRVVHWLRAGESPLDVDYDIETGGTYTNSHPDVEGAPRTVRVRSDTGTVRVDQEAITY